MFEVSYVAHQQIMLQTPDLKLCLLEEFFFSDNIFLKCKLISVERGLKARIAQHGV